MCDELNRLLKQRQLLFDGKDQNWRIEKSDISGSGIFANKSYVTGEIIFTDTPIVLGPRSSALPPACVKCLKMDVPLIACSKGCRLPVCSSECENSMSHEEECKLLNSFSVKEGKFWSPLLYRALTPFRCLLISDLDKTIVQFLNANKNSKHVEMMILKKELQKKFSAEDESFLNLCCGVLNGTAFETEVCVGKTKVSLRGVYPLAGMMNHSCVPNTQRYFLVRDNVPKMYVLATVPIPQGTEITTTYSYLLWPTMVRRHYLETTKEFWCVCERCRDPSEFGTNLSALECPCGGAILPECSIDIKSDWHCSNCNIFIHYNQLPFAKPLKILNENGDMPEFKVKYFSIKEKIDEIWRLGHKNTAYQDLTKEELDYKEVITREILTLNDCLKLGDSRIKGLLSVELYETLKEKKKRQNSYNEEELFSIREVIRKIMDLSVE